MTGFSFFLRRGTPSSGLLRHRHGAGELLFAALFVAFCVIHVVVTLRWMVLPFPLEYREWAHVAAARTMAAGASPYEPGPGFYLYGFLYPGLGALWQRCTGADPAFFLRLLSYLCTWAAALLAAGEIRRRAGGVAAPAAGAALLLCTGWLNVTGSAHPAPLGTLLLVAACAVARKGRAWAAALLVVAAFYVKPYFLAGLLPVGLYFLMAGRRRFLHFSCALLAAGCLSVWGVRQLWPGYFVCNVVHHFNMSTFSLPHLARQLAWLGVFFFPLVLTAFAAVRRRPRLLFDDVWLLSAVTLFFVWLRLAGHVGAFLSYAYQLWLPPLVVFALSPGVRLPHFPCRRVCLFALLLVFSLGLSAWRFNLVAPPSEAQRAAWRRAQADVRRAAAATSACFSPLFAETAGGSKMVSLNTGETEYAPSLSSDRALMLRLFPETERFRQFAGGFSRRTDALLAARRFPVVVTDALSYVDEARLRAAGYKPLRRYVLRVGVHDVEASLWVLSYGGAARRS